jgi:hypothetical protein
MDRNVRGAAGTRASANGVDACAPTAHDLSPSSTTESLEPLLGWTGPCEAVTPVAADASATPGGPNR